MNNTDFTRHNRKEIVFILEDLMKQRTGLNIGTPEGVTLLSSILEVDIDNDILYLDISPDERINRRIATSQQVTLYTQGGVEIRWHATDIQIAELSDGDAFYISIPASIERIQRREYFRLPTPQGSNALICKMPNGKEPFLATLADLSVGGIGLAVKGPLPAFISQGAILENCCVDFPGHLDTQFALKVFSARPTHKTRNGEQMYHVGLGFEELPGRAGNIVQRYMVQLELERMGRV